MTIHKDHISPTKVVSLRLPIEMYEKYVAEASAFDCDLSPHLINRLSWYEFILTEQDSLNNTFCNLSKERDKYSKEQVKLLAEIKSQEQTITTLRKSIETMRQSLDNEKEKTLKSHQEFTQILGQKNEALLEKDAEITTLKQQNIATMKQIEETLDKIIDKAHDYYLDAPMFSKMNLDTFEKPLKKIYFDVFPKPENKPKSLFSVLSSIANRGLKEFPENS